MFGRKNKINGKIKGNKKVRKSKSQKSVSVPVTELSGVVSNADIKDLLLDMAKRQGFIDSTETGKYWVRLDDVLALFD